MTFDIEIQKIYTLISMRIIPLILLLFGVVGKQNSMAQTPTFSENVASILYNNCTNCHRTGGIGPFALENYTDAVNNGLAIRNAVSSGYMPPWPPDTTYSRFSHERVLNQHQIALIVDWVDGNMPQGNPANEPVIPPISTNSGLSETPGGVYQIPTYSVASNQDDYRAFVIPSALTQTQAITEIEFIPGNRRIVHHILLFYDTTGLCQGLDDADPLPGFVASGGIGNANAKQLGGWVPGSPPLKLPGGFGMPAFANGKFVVQIHYAPGSSGQMDSTSFAVVYKPITPQLREVFQIPILNHYTSMINGPIYLNPNQKKLYIEAFTAPIPVTVLGVTPHMHLIGRSHKVWALKPGQSDTTKIIRVKDWNFNWQGQYMFKRALVLPQGSLVRSEAFYDNSEDNPFNPSSPPALVTAGESTLNEMMLTYFAFATYKPGDENLVLDSVLTSKSKSETIQELKWRLVPTKVFDEIYLLSPGMESGFGTVSIKISDGNGRLVRSLKFMPEQKEIGGAYRISLSGLAGGLYQAVVSSGGKNQTMRFSKDR